jgi:hypothetical protein
VRLETSEYLISQRETPLAAANNRSIVMEVIRKDRFVVVTAVAVAFAGLIAGPTSQGAEFHVAPAGRDDS